MTEKIINSSKLLIVKLNRDIISLLTWATALVLVFAYLAEHNQSKLSTVLVYLAACAVSFVLRRAYYGQQPQRMAHLILGAAVSFGILLMSIDGFWTWWIALIAISLLLSVPGIRSISIDINTAMIYGIMTAFAAVVGALMTEEIADGEADVALLGVGILLIGQGVLLMQYVTPQVTTSSGGGVLMSSGLSAESEMELSTRIHVTADSLLRSIQAINDVTAQQSSGANEQVDVIKLTNELLLNFLTLSGRINDQAHAMTKTSDQTAEASQEGQKSITQAIDSMNQIRGQVSNIGSTIVTLAQLTSRIDDIITSVTEIATQSNLLALNASIEAARAGAHGRGFAVVADEVRSLSRQSTSAARQVRAILAEIQSAVRQTVNATEIGMQGVDAGVTMTQQADRIMMQLSSNVIDSSTAVKGIYEVIRQQADGLEEIAVSMERIDLITQQNLASTRMVSTVATNLGHLTDDLQEVRRTIDAVNPLSESMPD